MPDIELKTVSLSQGDQDMIRNTVLDIRKDIHLKTALALNKGNFNTGVYACVYEERGGGGGGGMKVQSLT